ncbi:MAG TPA: DUF433 domain-containing protein [Terriglobales bacterium]|nr:DUF433 domain-containing protein [Terriglobales bacterium]
MPSRVVTVSPEIMGGAPVFAGTRVPVQTFIEHLKAGDSIDSFLEGFPSVSREQVLALLDEVKDHIFEMVH